MKHVRASLFALWTLAMLAAIAWRPAQVSVTTSPNAEPQTQATQAGLQAAPQGSAVRDVETSPLTSVGEFETLAARSLKNLPTNDSLRSLTSDEVHYTPPLLTNAALELGDVAEALEAKLEQAGNDPTAKAQAIRAGISYYRECTSGTDYPDSIRALCYSHYRELREKAGDPETVDQASDVPENVRDLADFLAVN